MGPANRRGPAAPDLTAPPAADPAELRRRIDAGEWVVDLRQRRAFAGRHLAGSISVELGDPFATYLGWTMPWGTPLTLIGDSPEQVAERAARTGPHRHRPAGRGRHRDRPSELGRRRRLRQLPGRPTSPAWRPAGTRAGRVVLDVRRPDEWRAGHLAGAVHIPFWELEGRIGRGPGGRGLGALRAAASGPRSPRRCWTGPGRRVVHIDDDWERAEKLGLPVTTDS